MTLDYEYTCPECGTDYCGDIDCDDLNDSIKKVRCEECDYEMEINVEVDVIVNVS